MAAVADNLDNLLGLGPDTVQVVGMIADTQYLQAVDSFLLAADTQLEIAVGTLFVVVVDKLPVIAVVVAVAVVVVGNLVADMLGNRL